MNDTVALRDEPVLKKYVFASAGIGRAVVNPAAVSSSVVRAGSARVDPEKNCEGWFAEDELDVLRQYFARHVYRDGLTFWEWCIPRMLATIERSRIRSVPKCPAQSVERLFKKLRAKGVIG